MPSPTSFESHRVIHAVRWFVTLGELPREPHAGVYATLLFAATLATLLLPFSRGALLLRSARRLLLSPFVSTYLWDAFVADAVTSLVKPLVDLAYSLCFIGTGEWLSSSHGGCLTSPLIGIYVTPLLCALPLWIRFMQNLRVYHDTHRRVPLSHCRLTRLSCSCCATSAITGRRVPSLPNALKYACGGLIVLFGAMHPTRTFYASALQVCSRQINAPRAPHAH